MRTRLLISTAAAILLLGAGAVSAQGMKTDETPAAPAAQQNAPPEKMAPPGKSDESKAPESDINKKQAKDKGIPAGTAAKGSSDTNGTADVKSKRASRHIGGRYAGGYHGLFDSYRGDRGSYACRSHRHGWTPWLWC
jgi:hypothetical protein